MRRILLAAGTLIALLLAWRALAGPYRLFRFHVASPFTLESLFVAVTAALLLAHKRPGDESPRHVAFAPAIIAIAVAAAFSPNLRDPFISDDYTLAATASLDAHRIPALFRAGGGDGAYRPLGYIYYGLVHSFAGANPAIWHVVSLSLHIANCLLLFALASALWPQRRTAALVAALLFGLHGTRPEVVTWTSDQFDLLACLFTLLAARCVFSRRRRASGRIALALLFVLAALLCKESAYAAPVIVAGLAAAAGRFGERAVRVFIGASFALCAFMFAFRWMLFHGPGGYVDQATGRPAILSLHFLGILKALGVRIWDLLLFPVNWDAPGGLWLGCAIVASSIALLAAFSHRGIGLPSAAALAALTAAAVVPAIHLALIGESAFGSRILYLPAAGFFLLVGHGVASIPDPRKRLAVAALMSFGCVGMLEHNLRVWHEAAITADRVCSSVAAGDPSAPASPEAQAHLPGILSFGNGLRECVSLKQGK